MTYGLPDDYQARPEPQYFNDTLADSVLWQGDVYRIAARLARKSERFRLIDIGCGRGSKLMQYANQFEICGIDYGENIEYCMSKWPDETWVTYDLNEEVISPLNFVNSVTLCADVIEHLPTPDALIETFKSAVQIAAYVLISTPDRERLQQGTLNGPPANSAHCREWTENELRTWLNAEGLPIVWSGWTISHDREPNKKNTILTVLSKTNTIVDFPQAFERSMYE